MKPFPLTDTHTHTFTLLAALVHFIPQHSQPMSLLNMNLILGQLSIAVLLGMRLGATPRSWPAWLYKPCPLLEWNGHSWTIYTVCSSSRAVKVTKNVQQSWTFDEGLI